MGEREICIEELDARGLDEWVMKIESEVENDKFLNTRETDVWKKHTIYKIPEGFISDEKRKPAYKPQVVSMGPYHHGEEQLLPMEEHKRRALRRFLVRTQKSIREYHDALRGVVQELMASYKDLENVWKNDEKGFLQLMISDGCFMMELLRTDGRLSTLKGYDENDPIFGHRGMLSNMPRIKRDMLMIENQIPLLVLKKLLSVERGVFQDEQKQRSLNKEVNNNVLAFFELEEEKGTEPMTSKKTSLLPWRTKENGISATPWIKNSDPTNTKKSTTEPPSSTTTAMSKLDFARDEVELGLHALDVVRKSMIKDIKGGQRGEPGGSNDVIWPATQLQEAGIKFRKSGSPSLKDIDFINGYLYATLSLPQLLVDDATESKFLNLMAFEHLHVSSGNEVSSYVCFMDNIIDSEKDVSLLSQNDIIKNFVGTDQAVADLFNGISHDVSIDPASNLSTVHKNVTEYCNDPCKKNLANLKHGYFSTPWSAIAFLAASVALFITIIQFVYSILDYYRS